MTFFLGNDGASPIEPPLVPEDARPPENDDAGFGDVFGAGWRAETIRTDAWGYSEKKRRALAIDMLKRLPQDAQARIADHQFDHENSWERPERAILKEVEAAAEADPGAWADYPLSVDDFEARILDERRDELREAQDILDLPGGGFAEFLGAGTRAMTDRTSLMLLPIGISGSPVRFIAGEAALGAAGEAAILPREFDVAAELGEPDPNPVARIAGGALLGGGLSGLVAYGPRAAMRGASYANTRLAARRAGKPDDVDALDHDASVVAAERRLRDELTPGDVIGRASQPDPAPAPVDDEIVGRIIGVESGGRANAANPNSSAEGLGQFIDSTWLNMIAKYRPDLMQGNSRAQLLVMKRDAALSWQMTKNFMRENRDYLASRGLPAGDGELYLAHFLGAGGAAKALSTPLNTPIGRVLSQQQIAANRGIRFNGRSFSQFTVGDLRAWANHKMNRAGPVSPPSGDVPTFTTSRGYTGPGHVAARADGDVDAVDIDAALSVSGGPRPRAELAERTDVAVYPGDAGLPRLDLDQVVARSSLHQAARDASPEVIRKFDALRARQRSYRAWIADIQSGRDRDISETLSAIDRRLDDLSAERSRVQGEADGARLRAEIREAKADRDDLLALRGDVGDTPDVAQLRADIQRVDEQIRDIAPEVTAAYAAARRPDGGVDQDLLRSWSDYMRARSDAASSDARVAREVSGEGLPEGAFADGAASPEAQAADAVALDDLRASVGGADAELRSDLDRARADLGDFDIDLPDGSTWRASELLDDIEADQELADVIDICAMGGGRADG